MNGNDKLIEIEIHNGDGNVTAKLIRQSSIVDVTLERSAEYDNALVGIYVNIALLNDSGEYTVTPFAVIDEQINAIVQDYKSSSVQAQNIKVGTYMDRVLAGNESLKLLPLAMK